MTWERTEFEAITRDFDSLKARMEALRNALRAEPAKPALWTVEDIAQYCQLSPAHVRDRLTHKPWFPQPVLVGRAKRWSASAVQAAIEEQGK